VEPTILLPPAITRTEQFQQMEGELKGIKDRYENMIEEDSEDTQ